MSASASGRSLVSTTHAASVALRAARATESTLIAVTAFALILASAVHSSGEVATLQELVLSLVCALLAGLSWWWPHRLGERSVAARLDSKLNLDGAYLTAWEVEAGRVNSSPIASLLGTRLLARIRNSHAIRAALPHSAPWIAAPFVAAAILALALGEVRSSHQNSTMAVAARSLAAALADLRSEAARDGKLNPDDMERLDQAAAEARDLAVDASSIEEQDTADLERRMSELASELSRLASDSPADSDLRQELEESQVLADQALMTLPELAKPSDSGKTSVNPEASSGTEVASGTDPGTMSGSPDGAVSPKSDSPDLTMRTESEDDPNSAGVYSRGRWWPAQDDELVSSWVEALRDLD